MQSEMCHTFMIMFVFPLLFVTHADVCHLSWVTTRQMCVTCPGSLLDRCVSPVLGHYKTDVCHLSWVTTRQMCVTCPGSLLDRCVSPVMGHC